LSIVLAHIIFTLAILLSPNIYNAPGLHLYVGIIAISGIGVAGGSLLYYLIAQLGQNLQAAVDAAMLSEHIVALTQRSVLSRAEVGSANHIATALSATNNSNGDSHTELRVALASVRRQILDEAVQRPEKLVGVTISLQLMAQFVAAFIAALSLSVRLLSLSSSG
jgi:hypothetical protein